MLLLMHDCFPCVCVYKKSGGVFVIVFVCAWHGGERNFLVVRERSVCVWECIGIAVVVVVVVVGLCECVPTRPTAMVPTDSPMSGRPAGRPTVDNVHAVWRERILQIPQEFRWKSRIKYLYISLLQKIECK